MFHNLLASEFKTWTPDQIGKLTPTQLLVLGQSNPPNNEASTTVEQYEDMLASRERERPHWER